MKASLLFLLAVGCISVVFADVSTVTPRPTPSQWFQCPGEGYYPHPYDCSKYFICVVDSDLELIAWLMKCPGKLWFNPEKNLCDFRGNVDCQAQPTGGS
ncbi:uncharacterized protein [Hetaerina americana]|uniref:uncharacterized protein n=1 Tax=Hetaerina americana TaxID=62018 RepID=UPI003A7F4D75